MQIIFYTHPFFLGHQSMPRFTNMLAKGMAERGHEVEIWYPSPFFANLSRRNTIKKYLGYIDQLIIFPFQAKKKMNKRDVALHILTDHALGPWMAFLKNRKHVVHCHDFIAQKAGLGLMEDFAIGRSGKIYQSIIKKGFSQAKNFISVSETTKIDLHKIISKDLEQSEVVYNGLNQNFEPSKSVNELRNNLSTSLNHNLSDGFILHIGNNEWYKNRAGVIKLYDHWRVSYEKNLPLIMVGPKPTKEQYALSKNSNFHEDILFLSNVENSLVKKLYAAATLLLFPSYAEGFGWPIAEAMASGCPVITTFEAPMTEVGAEAAFYIPKGPCKDIEEIAWLKIGAKTIQKVSSLKPKDRTDVISKGIKNAQRFDAKKSLDVIEVLYKTYHQENYENNSCS